MIKDYLEKNLPAYFRYPSVRFGVRKPSLHDAVVEDLIKGAKIIHSYSMYGIVIITNDFSRCVIIYELTVEELKAVVENSRNVDELFEHLKFLTTMELPVIEFTHFLEDKRR